MDNVTLYQFNSKLVGLTRWAGQGTTHRGTDLEKGRSVGENLHKGHMFL